MGLFGQLALEEATDHSHDQLRCNINVYCSVSPILYTTMRGNLNSLYFASNFMTLINFNAERLIKTSRSETFKN
jgi:hypothetical protein